MSLFAVRIGSFPGSNTVWSGKFAGQLPLPERIRLSVVYSFRKSVLIGRCTRQIILPRAFPTAGHTPQSTRAKHMRARRFKHTYLPCEFCGRNKLAANVRHGALRERRECFVKRLDNNVRLIGNAGKRRQAAKLQMRTVRFVQKHRHVFSCAAFTMEAISLITPS